MNSKQSEYVLISYNINDDMAKKARYNRLKQRLIKRHIKQMKLLVQNPNTELVSRERLLRLTVPSESDWPRNVELTVSGEHQVSVEEVKQAIKEYEQCEKQEEAIKIYTDCLASLKKELKDKASEKPQNEQKEGNEDNTLTQRLQEALKRKIELDEEIAKVCSKMMEGDGL